MISSFNSENPMTSVALNCTIASSFEKPNSLRCEILFGEYLKKISQNGKDENFVNAYDYMFVPNQIFGLCLASTGRDFRKFHFLFVLRACEPGEAGNVVPGVSPGADVLIKTSTKISSARLMAALNKLRKNGVDLAKISASHYRHLGCLLDLKICQQFFIGELLEQHLG